jgi:hypothetical protein
MNAPPRGLPLRVDRDAARDTAVASLVRAAIVAGQRAFNFDRNIPTDNIIRERNWNDDRTLGMLVRAATAPAMTTQPGWAAELSHVAQSFLRTLVPMSAAAQLLDACLSLRFDRTAKITLPIITPGTAEFVAEGQPIRVPKMPTGPGPSLEPCKLASIVELTTEMMESSNVEAITKQALVDSTAPSLDAAVFSNAAAVPGLRPPGILNGASAITASASTSKAEAMDDDLCKLVETIAPFAGNGSVAFVCSPAQATRIMLRAERPPGLVLMSGALASGTVVALATNALAAAVEPVRIDAAKSAVIHEETTTPLPIASPGSPIVVAAPTRSLWQTDSVALRVRLPCSWVIRDSRAVSVVTATKW